MACIGQFEICLKWDILIIDTWNEYIKKSDGMVNFLFYRKFNVRMPLNLSGWMDIILTNLDFI